MNSDATVLVVAIVAGMLFSGGLLVVVGTLILLHYVIHTRRVSEQDACFKKIRELEIDVTFQKERVQRMESLNASMALELIEALKILSSEVPKKRAELTGMIDSLVTLFHAYVDSTGLTIDAKGNVIVQGDVVGKDKKVQNATG